QRGQMRARGLFGACPRGGRLRHVRPPRGAAILSAGEARAEQRMTACPLHDVRFWPKADMQSYSVLPADDLAFARAWLAAVPVRVISSPDRLNTRPPQRYRATRPAA